MSDIVKTKTNFIGYEYRDVTVRREFEHLYIDHFPNFGWLLESISHSSKGPLHSVLRFKRDRKLNKKMELTRLQRQFEASVKDIAQLETSKYVSASAAAYIIGLIGTAFIAGSTFSYLGANILLCILLAVPGFTGWVLPYFLFLKIRDKKTETLTPLIDKQYELLYSLCEKAYNLQSEI